MKNSGFKKIVESHPVFVLFPFAVFCSSITFAVTNYLHTERVLLSSEKNKLEFQEISNKHNYEVRELEEKFEYIKRDFGGIEYINLKNLLVLGENKSVPKKSELLHSGIYSSKVIEGLTYEYDPIINNTNKEPITSIDNFYDSLKSISHTHRWQSDVAYNFRINREADSQPIYAKIELKKVKKRKLKILMARFLNSSMKIIPELALPSEPNILLPSEDEIVVNTDDADVIGSLSRAI